MYPDYSEFLPFAIIIIAMLRNETHSFYSDWQFCSVMTCASKAATRRLHIFNDGNVKNRARVPALFTKLIFKLKPQR